MTQATEVKAPTLTPVVYLRGAGVRPVLWENIEQAMWAEGWATTHHRTDAWHMARGGVPVVLCDFSAGDCTGDQLTVGRVRARYEEDVSGTVEMDIQLTNGGAGSRPKAWAEDATGHRRYRLDVGAVVERVAEALATRRA